MVMRGPHTLVQRPVDDVLVGAGHGKQDSWRFFQVRELNRPIESDVHEPPVELLMRAPVLLRTDISRESHQQLS